MYYRKRAPLIQLLLWSSVYFESTCSSQAQTGLILESSYQPVLTFDQTWYSLGPFRIGTREAIWGADPLEALGGFSDIQFDTTSSFRSSLAPNATVKWSKHKFVVEHLDHDATVQFDISHTDIDWTFQQQVYGWAALQFQTWVRGSLHNSASKKTKAWIHPQGLLELYLNGQRYFGGDFFNFDRAPILVDLRFGLNVFNVRLIRDVRAMGGVSPPSIEALLRITLAKQQPEIDYDHVVVPDVVDGRLPSRYFSFPISNPLNNWILVSDCHRKTPSAPWSFRSNDTRIAPGQTRPVMFEVSDQWTPAKSISGVLCYHVESVSGPSKIHSLRFAVHLKRRRINEASKFTFIHPSGVVSYAILKPPVVKVEQNVPLLLLLHGAGLEADSYQVRHSLDGMPDLEAFALFPTGMSPWSGDDWHLWGIADALGAAEAVSEWMMRMRWNGTHATTNRVVLSGHSNGGQGTWFFATHFPDRVIAAAPASAYTSIENYVPYNLWSEADPLKSGIVHTARGNYRPELLVENLASVPILQQHGSADDNVPPYHARLMSTLREEVGMKSDYIELAGKPHWWEGAITTTPLQNFYKENLKNTAQLSVSGNNFSIVVPGAGEINSKFGIVVDQLQSPDRSGRIEVVTSTNGSTDHWHLSTFNIHRLHFDFTNVNHARLLHVTFDSGSHTFSLWNEIGPYKTYVRSVEGDWTCSTEDWKGLNQRYGRQRGALDASLRSNGPFLIVSCVEGPELAVQVSRNLFQYYGADATIMDCQQYEDAVAGSGNVILLVIGPEVSSSQLDIFPITVTEGKVYLRTTASNHRHEIAGQPGTGAIFLRPLEAQRLELVVWGIDVAGLGQAVRLVPMLTGGGQPDFVVLGSKAKFQGYGGAIAMGFLDHAWNISRASYMP